MALDPIIEEYIYELTRGIGDFYTAVISGIGSADIPGTALFELSQLNDLAKQSAPYFGILRFVDKNNINYQQGFTVTVPSELSKKIQISSAHISYGTQVIKVPSQTISIAKSFADIYPNDYAYGVVLGFPITEAKNATTTHNTLVAENTDASSYTLKVDDVTIAQQLGFPLDARVGTEYVKFVAIQDGKLVIDPTGDGLTSMQFEGSPVYFIYSPRVKAIYGLPVSSTYQAGLNADAFTYYPPLPNDWLPIARLLVVNPSNPYVAQYNDRYAIQSLVTDWPYSSSASPLFNSVDSQTIVSATEAASRSLIAAQKTIDLRGIMQALHSYTNALKQNNSITFREFWGNRPFKPTSYFSRGVAFSNLEKFEFPESFKKAYYDFYKNDLQHTFAIFRGDLYEDKYNRGFNTPPDSITITPYDIDYIDTRLSNGTYIYGITAIDGAGNETRAAYNQSSHSSTGYINEIKAAGVDNAVYYHIYRRENIVGDQIEYCLTENNQLLNLEPAQSVDISTLPGNSCELDSSKYYAIPLNANGNANVLLCGGIGLKLRFAADNSVLNADAYLSVSVYEYDSDNNLLGDKVADGTTIPYSSIASSAGFNEYISKLPVKYLTKGEDYAIVIHMSAAAIDASDGLSVIPMYIYQDTEGSAIQSSAALSGLFEDVDNTFQTYYRIYGYIDDGTQATSVTTRRGIRLTNTKSFQPRRLRVRVPDIVLSLNEPYSKLDSGAEIPANSTNTRNDINITVIAKLGENGVASAPMTVTVPQNTVRGWTSDLGNENDLYDRIIDVQVSPGDNLQISNGQINWSIYDLVIIETKP